MTFSAIAHRVGKGNGLVISAEIDKPDDFAYSMTVKLTDITRQESDHARL